MMNSALRGALNLKPVGFETLEVAWLFLEREILHLEMGRLINYWLGS